MFVVPAASTKRGTAPPDPDPLVVELLSGELFTLLLYAPVRAHDAIAEVVLTSTGEVSMLIIPPPLMRLEVMIGGSEGPCVCAFVFMFGFVNES
jgi:hypothetical protein